MPWFKVDDGLFLHQKIVKAGNAAMGLWLRAGSWSAHHLTEGFIPDAVIEVLGTPIQRNKLIKVGLWSEAEGGVRFHEWTERQPTRDEVTEQRSAWTERKRKSRANLREKSTGPAANLRENLESPASSQVNDMSHASVSPSYSRPVPSIEEQEIPTGSLARSGGHLVAVQPPLLDVVTDPSPPAPAKAKQGHRLPEDWKPSRDAQVWSRQYADRVDITVEWAKFQDYWLSKPGAGGRKLDWDRTWKNWVRTAVDRSPATRAASKPNPHDERVKGMLDLAERYRLEEEREAQANRKAING